MQMLFTVHSGFVGMPLPVFAILAVAGQADIPAEIRTAGLTGWQIEFLPAGFPPGAYNTQTFTIDTHHYPL